MEETNKLSIFKQRQEKHSTDDIPLIEIEPPLSLSEKRTSISKIFAKQKIGSFSTDLVLPKAQSFIDRYLEKKEQTPKIIIENTREVQNTKPAFKQQTFIDKFFPSRKPDLFPDIKVVIENRQNNKLKLSNQSRPSSHSHNLFKKHHHNNKESNENLVKEAKSLSEYKKSRIFSNLNDDELSEGELKVRQEVFRKTLATKCVKKEEVSEEEKKRMVAKKMRERRREEEGRKKEKKEENSVKLAQERNRMLRLFRKTMGESSKIREKELEEMFKNREVLTPTDFNVFLDIQKLVEKKSYSELFRTILSFSSSKANPNLRPNPNPHSSSLLSPSPSSFLAPHSSSLLAPHSSSLLPPRPLSSSIIPFPPPPPPPSPSPAPTVKLTTVFSSAHEYVDILKSLFFKEVRCQIENSIETTKKLHFKGGQNKKYRLQILKEKTYEIFCSLEIEEVGVLLPNKTEIYDENAKNIKKIDFYPPQGNLFDDFDIIYSKNYLVILTNMEEIKGFNLLEDKERKNPQHFMILGILLEEKVKANSKKIITLEDPDKLYKYFVEKDATVFVTLLPVDKLATYQREYIAIHGFPLTNLVNDVIAPKNAENPDNTENSPSPYDSILPILKENYNPSQFSAIKGAVMSTDNIVLLQGPPGTGKTHTLLGLVAAIYHKIHCSSSPFLKKPQILICAPSNAAIDEIIFRLMNEGIFNSAYKPKPSDPKNLQKSKLDHQEEVCDLEEKIKIKPKVVRIGVIDKNPNEIIKSVSIESLAQKALDGEKGEERGKEEIRQKLFSINKKLEEMKEKDSEEARKERNLILEQRRQLKWKMMECRKNKEIRREKYTQIVNQILMEADIICSTLSSSGSDKLEIFKNRIEALIIDEASQATEPSNLIPFQILPSKVILIGDPKQLPSTTFSPDAAQTNYNRSLFERLLLSGKEPFFLEIQYRMESNIREFASCAFYGGRLKDDDIIRKREWPDYLKSFKAGGGGGGGGARGGARGGGGAGGGGGNSNNMLFVEVRTSRERQMDFSFRNEGEAKLALCLCEGVLRQLGGFIRANKQAQIGFISPYKAQIDYFRGLVRDRMRDKMGEIQINTVDSFQGQEKDVIILSTVRSGNELGFVKDLRRMNVALTRARFVLIVLGTSETLGNNEFWFKLLESYHNKQQCASLDNESLIPEFVDNLINNPNSRPKQFYNFQLPIPRRTVKKLKISDNSELPVKKEIWTKPIHIDPDNIIHRIKKKETQNLLDEDNRKIHKINREKKKEASQAENLLEIEAPPPQSNIKDNKSDQKYDILGLPIYANSSLSSLITGVETKKKVIPKNNFLYDIT